MMRRLGNWVFKQNKNFFFFFFFFNKKKNFRAISKNRMADHAKCPLPFPFLVLIIALAFCAAV